MYKILLIEENTILRTGIEALFVVHHQFQLIESANSIEEAVTIKSLAAVDLIITDISSNPLKVTRDMEALRSSFPEARILIFTWADKKESALAAMEANAATYLLKEASGEKLLETLRQLMDERGDSEATILPSGA